MKTNKTNLHKRLSGSARNAAGKLTAALLTLTFGLAAHAFNFAPAGSEFQVHTTVVGAQHSPDVAMDANGNFVVVWFSATFAYATSGGFAQRFDNNGNAVGAEFKFGDLYSVSGNRI